MMAFQLKIRTDDWYEITSPDVPGFSLVGNDLPRMMGDVVCAAVMMAHNGTTPRTQAELTGHGFQ